MEIKTGIKQTPVRLAPAKTAAVSKPNQEAQAEAPKDSFGTTVKDSALGEARDYYRSVGDITGGMGGLLGVAAGAWTGLAGGAIVGMAAGAAVAAPIATVFSNGGLDFIKTGFQSVGVGGKIGMVAGAVTLAAGGWVMGRKTGQVVGGAIPAAIGLTAGAGKGVLRHLGAEAGALPAKRSETKKDDGEEFGKDEKWLDHTRGITGAIGGFTGVAGGAAIGAVAWAGVETISGIANGNFDIGALLSAGGTGALIGGGAGLVTGFVGGAQIAKGVQNVVGGIAEASSISRKLIEQDKKKGALNDFEAEIDLNQAKFKQEVEAGDKNIANRESSLNSRNEKLSAEKVKLNDTITNESGITVARSNELYTNETQRLSTYEAKLDGDKIFLDSEQVRLTGKEGDIKNLIRTEATTRRENHRTENQNRYDTRKAGLESREDDLKGQELNIDKTADQQVQAELEPLRQQAREARNEARDNRNTASNYRSDASSMESQVGGVLADARNLESRANSQESQNSSLRSQKNSLEREVSSVESRLSSCEIEKRAKEQERRRDSGGSNGHKDGDKWGGGGGSSGHKRDNGKWG